MSSYLLTKFLNPLVLQEIILKMFSSYTSKNTQRHRWCPNWPIILSKLLSLYGIKVGLSVFWHSGWRLCTLLYPTVQLYNYTTIEHYNKMYSYTNVQLNNRRTSHCWSNLHYHTTVHYYTTIHCWTIEHYSTMYTILKGYTIPYSTLPNCTIHTAVNLYATVHNSVAPDKTRPWPFWSCPNQFEIVYKLNIAQKTG